MLVAISVETYARFCMTNPCYTQIVPTQTLHLAAANAKAGVAYSLPVAVAVWACISEAQ